MTTRLTRYEVIKKNHRSNSITDAISSRLTSFTSTLSQARTRGLVLRAQASTAACRITAVVRYRTTRFAGTPAARTQTHRARQYTAPTASPAAAIDALQTHDARSGPHPLGRALELRAPPFVDSAPGDIPYPLHTIPSPFRQAINPPSPISPSLRCSRLAARRRPRTCRPSRAASSRAQDPS